MSARPHDNCYWVLPDRLMAGEYPWRGQGDAAQRHLGSIIAAGVDHFIDLTCANELDPYAPLLRDLAPAEGRQVGYERHPIVDLDVPHSPAHAEAILDRIDALLAAGRVPYVHCWGGVGRTGTVIGCWLVRQGHSGEQALAVLAGHWATVEKRTRHRRSPETEAQRRYVLEWAQHDPRAAAGA